MAAKERGDGSRPKRAPLTRERADRWCALAAALVGFLVFANSLANGLAFDGLDLLTGDEVKADPFALREILLQPYQGPPAYRPLTSWSVAWTCWANAHLGLQVAHPLLHHLPNVLLHAAACALIFVLLRDLGLRRYGALAGAFLFAAHPIHTEVVAGVVGRSELLAAGFGMLFLISHRRAWRAPVSMALYALALLGKESAIGFAVVAVACDLLLPPRGSTPRRDLLRWGSYLSVCIGWFVLRGLAISSAFAVSSDVELDKNPLLASTTGARLLTALRVQFDYLMQQASPIPHLAAEYSFDEIPVVDTPWHPRVLGFLIVLAIAIGVAWRVRRSAPQVGLALLAYAVLLAPTSNLLTPIGTIRADRFLYGPSIMTCLLLGLLFQRLCARRPLAARVALYLLIACHCAVSIQRNHVWRDQDAFYAALVVDAPRHQYARLRRSQILYVAKDYQGALTHLRAADAIRPLEEGMALVVLGDICRRLQRWDEAAVAYQRALEVSPTLEVAQIRRIIALLESGRKEEARAAIQVARESPMRDRLFRALDDWKRSKQRGSPH